MSDLNNKLTELSRGLLELHVREVFQKNKSKLKFRNLSEQEKERMRKLYYDLESQVNQFVDSLNNREEIKEEVVKKTRTTIRDLMNKRKNS